MMGMYTDDYYVGLGYSTVRRFTDWAMCADTLYCRGIAWGPLCVGFSLVAVLSQGHQFHRWVDVNVPTLRHPVRCLHVVYFHIGRGLLGMPYSAQCTDSALDTDLLTQLSPMLGL